MKKKSTEIGDGDVAVKRAGHPPPPLPPPPPSFLKKNINNLSVTNWEIANYWRQKRLNEEDHLLAAIKAAARIRAHKLTDEDYKRFEESLKKDDDSKVEDPDSIIENEKDLRIGIKDWWTKSKYAYLNQPAVGSASYPKTSSYIPNFCNYKPPPPHNSWIGIF